MDNTRREDIATVLVRRVSPYSDEVAHELGFEHAEEMQYEMGYIADLFVVVPDVTVTISERKFRHSVGITATIADTSRVQAQFFVRTVRLISRDVGLITNR